MAKTILEIKYRPGKEPLEWTCEAVDVDPPTTARIRYVSDADVVIEGTRLPAGTVTDAVYWCDRPYHVWRFSAPQGKLLGYRFDVCTDTFIWTEKLIWTDLELDLWIRAGGEPRWQDEDEIAELVRMEHLSRKELAIAEDAKAYLEEHWRDVIEEAFGEKA